MDDFKRAQALYNKHARHYVDNINQDSKLLGVREFVYGLISPAANKEILCIGCGDGIECVPLAENKAAVIGIDSSSELINRAKKLYSKYGIEYLVMDYEDTSFQDESFDVILSIMSIAYKKNLTNVLLAQKRILKEEGTMVIVVHHPIRKMIKYADFDYFKSGLQYETCRGVKRFNYYRTIEDYYQTIKDSGMSVQSIFEPRPQTSEPCPIVNNIREDLYPHALIFVLSKGQNRRPVAYE